MNTVVFPLALVAYTAGMVLSVIGMTRRSRHARTAANLAYIAACVLHLLGILLHVGARGEFGINNLSEYLLGLGWLVISLYFLVQARWKMPGVGLILPPVAFVLTITALGLPSHEVHSLQLTSPEILLFHTSLSTLGMASFLVAAGMSLIYVLQDRALKHKKKLKLLNRLPSLNNADRAGLEAMLWGFPMFTFGIVTGIGLQATAQIGVWAAAAKVIFPVLAWLIFGGVLLARLFWGFRGRKAAYLTMAGFFLGLLTVLGISL